MCVLVYYVTAHRRITNSNQYFQCNLFAPELVRALESGLDPENACEAINFCKFPYPFVLLNNKVYMSINWL